SCGLDVEPEVAAREGQNTEERNMKKYLIVLGQLAIGTVAANATLMLTQLVVVILVFMACASATASTTTIFIDPAAAFTLTYDDSTLASSPISLASLGIYPGDVIVLQEV